MKRSSIEDFITALKKLDDLLVREDIDAKDINLMVADISGLIKTKAKAIHDGGLVPRTTDKKDLVAALKYIGIDNIQALDTRPEYGFIKERFGRCYNYLTQIQEW